MSIGEDHHQRSCAGGTVTFFDARLSRGTSNAGSRVLVSRKGSGVGQNRGSGEFSGRANGSGKGGLRSAGLLGHRRSCIYT
jgi:hypothetical protein